MHHDKEKAPADQGEGNDPRKDQTHEPHPGYQPRSHDRW